MLVKNSLNERLLQKVLKVEKIFCYFPKYCFPWLLLQYLQWRPRKAILREVAEYFSTFKTSCDSLLFKLLFKLFFFQAFQCSSKSKKGVRYYIM